MVLLRHQEIRIVEHNLIAGLDSFWVLGVVRPKRIHAKEDCVSQNFADREFFPYRVINLQNKCQRGVISLSSPISPVQAETRTNKYRSIPGLYSHGRKRLHRRIAHMNPNKALWEKGDFTEIAAFMRESAEAVVASIGITPPVRVLDLGCGDGTTALPLAELGADVTGIDIAENLIEAGKRRAAEAGLERLRFHQGDACELKGVSDHSFDLTLSMFGAMFAPRPFDVAGEMVRVTKPGGRIMMGNWIPGDPTFVSQLLKISSSFLPPPPEGFVSPMTWGLDTHIVERFGRAGVPKEKISMSQDTYYFHSSDKTPTQFIETFTRFYGPTMNAFEAAENSGRVEELTSQLIKLAKAQNKSANGGTSIPATFLRVTVNV